VAIELSPLLKGVEKQRLIKVQNRFVDFLRVGYSEALMVVEEILALY